MHSSTRFLCLSCHAVSPVSSMLSMINEEVFATKTQHSRLSITVWRLLSRTCFASQCMQQKAINKLKRKPKMWISARFLQVDTHLVSKRNSRRCYVTLSLGRYDFVLNLDRPYSVTRDKTPQKTVRQSAIFKAGYSFELPDTQFCCVLVWVSSVQCCLITMGQGLTCY